MYCSWTFCEHVPCIQDTPGSMGQLCWPERRATDRQTLSHPPLSSPRVTCFACRVRSDVFPLSTWAWWSSLSWLRLGIYSTSSVDATALWLKTAQPQPSSCAWPPAFILICKVPVDWEQQFWEKVCVWSPLPLAQCDCYHKWCVRTGCVWATHTRLGSSRSY